MNFTKHKKSTVSLAQEGKCIKRSSTQGAGEAHAGHKGKLGKSADVINDFHTF